MKKKINMTIEEENHLKMKEIAIKERRYVYDLYDEAVSDFIKKFDDKISLDEKDGK